MPRRCGGSSRGVRLIDQRRLPREEVYLELSTPEEVAEHSDILSVHLALNERTRNILEEITAGFYSLDREGRFTYLNPSALRLFARSADQLLGKQWTVG